MHTKDKFIEETRELIRFIEDSPSPYHVVRNVTQMLEQQGYSRLYEHVKWELKPGAGYYVVRGDSSVIAFCLPEKTADHFHIIASHSDSPTFKIKENPERGKEGRYVTLNVEKYGGMLIGPWFDRPLSVAGRLLVQEEGALKTRLVQVDRDLLMLPSLAIHMDRSANEGHRFEIQKEIMPLYGEGREAGAFWDEVAESAGIEKEAVVSADLMLYPRTPGTIWGEQQAFFSAPKLDDLLCAYASVRALSGSRPARDGQIKVCCIFDNEEVGSGTKQGACSTFLQDTLERINACLGGSDEDYRMAVHRSFMLSADNGHAVHPNYPEKADPTNRPVMNGGVLIKYNANQKYTTDAVSAAIFKMICQKAEVPTQTYVNHSDVPGGSTLGNLSNMHVSLNTIDIGVAQLAMHSPYETAGTKDPLYMRQAMTAFYETKLSVEEDGYRIEA
ncbi:MAG: M18 family aminopeptidase [Lachnospiraceae bacterium]|nr:M18 family aminopeptidase [Lachnospiraceae bacterium]